MIITRTYTKFKIYGGGRAARLEQTKNDQNKSFFNVETMKQAAQEKLHGINVHEEETLDIRIDAPVAKGGVKAVCKDLGKQSCKIKRLVIKNIGGPDYARKYIVKSLAKNASITHLRINTSGDEAAEFLNGISKNKNSSIRTIHAIVDGIDATANFEQSFVGLKFITDLNVERLFAKSASKLFNDWKNIGTLQSLSYQGPTPSSELLQFLNHCQNLETISLTHLDHDFENAVNITSRIGLALAALPKLKNLQLRFDLSSDCAEALITGLKGSRTITELTISISWLIHGFSSSSAKNIIDALLSLKYATYLIRTSAYINVL
jgi:hypothetical protein